MLAAFRAPVGGRGRTCPCRRLPIDLRRRGGRSSVGRAPGCGPGGRGFESRRSPSENPALFLNDEGSGSCRPVANVAGAGGAEVRRSGRGRIRLPAWDCFRKSLTTLIPTVVMKSGGTGFLSCWTPKATPWSASREIGIATSTSMKSARRSASVLTRTRGRRLPRFAGSRSPGCPTLMSRFIGLLYFRESGPLPSRIKARNRKSTTQSGPATENGVPKRDDRGRGGRLSRAEPGPTPRSRLRPGRPG